MLNYLNFSQLTPSLSRIMNLKERKIVTTVLKDALIEMFNNYTK